MTSLPWFRLYSEILDDRKLKRVCRNTGEPKALIIGIWVTLLSLANLSDYHGKLSISEEMPFTLADLMQETDLDEKCLSSILDQFVKLDLLSFEKDTYEVIHWNDRQFKSDNSTARVRKHRQVNNETLHDALHETLPETSLKRSKNVIDTDTDSDIDTDTESYTESETEAEPKSFSPASLDQQQNLYRIYENEIGVLTSHIADSLKSALEDYPEEWIKSAILESSRHNKRSWSYAETILKRWKVDGFQSAKKPALNPTNSPPKPLLGLEAVKAEMKRLGMQPTGIFSEDFNHE